MEKIKCYTRDGYVNYYGSDELVMIPSEYDVKKDKFRGVWFSTVENIDLKPFENAEDGKKFIDGVIETYKKFNLNAIVFQARPTNDAMYKSELNPWSAYLNKDRIDDKDPGFDVFGYLVEQANLNGIEVHAWLNPYRVTNRDLNKKNMSKMDYLNTLSERNFARLNPDLVLETSEHHLILDPASVKVQEFLVETVLEIANNYNITAVHIDDYFYPYDEIVDEDEDKKRMQICPYLDKATFRRYNVNEMIRKIHEGLKRANKKVEFGISPFAVYRTNSKWFEKAGDKGGWYKGSNNIYTEFQCYEGLYSDIYLWMKEGWIDYVCPQNYFPLDGYRELENGEIVETVKYADVIRWWSNICKETKTKLYIGMGPYLVKDEGKWSNVEELVNQLKLNNTYDNVSGFTMFTYRNFVSDRFETMKKVQNRLLELWNK